jgi:hypothetical protein
MEQEFQLTYSNDFFSAFRNAMVTVAWYRASFLRRSRKRSSEQQDVLPFPFS